MKDNKETDNAVYKRNLGPTFTFCFMSVIRDLSITCWPY